VRKWLTFSALKLAVILAPAAGLLVAGTNPATITVNVTPNPWDQSQPLTVSVAVSGSAGPGTGAIELRIDGMTAGTHIPLTVPSGGAAGVASFTVPDAAYNIPSPNLGAGQHTLGVDYAGDSNYAPQGAVSNNVTFSVSAPSTTILSIAPTQLVIGQSVVFSANVTNGATGSVSFVDNGFQVVATANLAGNQAVTSPLTLTQGLHSIVAQYNGDANFSSSSSNSVTVSVGKANTTTVLTAPPANSGATAGTGITMSAQVTVQAPGSATLTGSIQFLDNGTLLSTQPISGTGSASFFAANLPAGSHALTAAYTGNSNLNGSTSAAVGFSVNGLATSTATPTSTGNAAVGQSITITTTVTAASGTGTPTGYVNFTDAGTSIGNIALNSSGTASVTTSTLSAGTHMIFANYIGDNTFAPSNSSVYVLSICPNNPTVTVTSSVASPVYGQAVIFTGSVSYPGSAGAPASGTMDFLADGFSMLPGTPLNLVNGQAQFGLASNAPLSAGAHAITVTYYCGTGSAGISSDSLSLTIGSDTTTTNLTASGPGGLKLTAYVLPNAPGFGMPTGTVQFMNGTTPFGNPVPLSSSSGIATATFTATAAGSVQAVYSGDANFVDSESAPVAISTQPTTVTLTSSENPANAGDNITFKAVVSNGSNNNVPTGTMSFLDGTTSLGSPVPVDPTGTAQYSTSALTSGSHVITAQFTPSGVFQSAQATLGQYVAPGGGGGGGFGPGSTMSASVNPQAPVYGQAVTLTGVVTPTGTGTPPAPTGQVTFKNGSTNLGTAAVGQGLVLNSLSPGAYNVTAAYGGDSVYPAAQATVSFVVAQAATQTTYVPKLNGSQATLVATVTVVTPGAGNPTGTVQFQDASQNNLTVASAALAGGTATAIVDASIATHQIIAVYNGDTNFAGSSSASQLQLVSTAANITGSFAPDEAVSAYHVTNLTGDTAAQGFPLGTTLGGASVKITDSTGVSWLAPLYGVFASASQINFVMPNTVALGPALFTMLLPGGNTMSTVANVTLTSPAIFTANQNGQGVAAGQFVHVAPGYVQTFDNIAVFDTTQNQYVPNPVSFGPDGNQLYLVLYGTGIRHRASDTDVTATINGVSLPNANIQTAAQGVYPGLDQMNLLLPRSLAGAGTVNVILTVNGQTANTVQIALQ